MPNFKIVRERTERTETVAGQIIQDERREREEKTAHLRALRLANEAKEKEAKKPTRGAISKDAHREKK